MTRRLDWVSVPAANQQARARASAIAAWPKQIQRVTGVPVTADATPHTKGIWAEVIASTTRRCHLLGINVSGVAASATSTAQLMDIGVGANPGETVLVGNIGVSSASSMYYMVPVGLNPGTRISARIQAEISADTATVAIATFECLRFVNIPSRVATLGTINTAASRSVTITANDTYEVITAATTEAFQALVICPSMAATSIGNTQVTYTLAVGASTAETVWGTYVATATSTEAFSTTIGDTMGWGICPGYVPAGSRVVCKVNSGANLVDVTVLGVPA